MFSILQGRLGPEPQYQYPEYDYDDDEEETEEEEEPPPADILPRSHFESCEQAASELLRTCLATGHLKWSPRLHQRLSEEHRRRLETWQLVARRRGLPREVARMVLSHDVSGAEFPDDKLVPYGGVRRADDHTLLFGIRAGGLQCARSRSFSPTEALQVIRDAAAALQWLHGQGIVHERMRAASIFVSPDLRQSKLAWYGLPRELVEDTGTKGAVYGVTYWVPPELLQESFEGMTFKSDLWGLGLAALELATGANPFEYMHPMRALFCISKQEPRLVGEEYPVELRRLVESCVLHDPERRSITF